MEVNIHDSQREVQELIIENEKNYGSDLPSDSEYSEKISFLTEGKIGEGLENIVSNIEKIKDTNSFHFEGEAGNEPAGKYQEACTQLIDYVNKLKDSLKDIHDGLKSEFEKVKTEIDNSFSWYGCKCYKRTTYVENVDNNF